MKTQAPIETKLVGAPFEGRTHGISLLRDQDDTLLVFVVEHPIDKADAVKVLRYEENTKTLFVRESLWWMRR
jgi:hypothetical protein